MFNKLFAEVIRSLPEDRRPTVEPSRGVEQCIKNPISRRSEEEQAAINAAVERLLRFEDPSASVRITNVLMHGSKREWSKDQRAIDEYGNVHRQLCAEMSLEEGRAVEKLSALFDGRAVPTQQTQP